MRRLALIALLTAPFAAKAEGVLPQAVAGYKASCLAAAPSFAGFTQKAKRAGFVKQVGVLTLPDNSTWVQLITVEGNCVCQTTLIAPDPNATAVAIIDASISARQVKQQPSPHKEIAAILEWREGTNALQVEADTQGQLPLVRAYLIGQGPCPKK